MKIVKIIKFLTITMRGLGPMHCRESLITPTIIAATIITPTIIAPTIIFLLICEG